VLLPHHSVVWRGTFLCVCHFLFVCHFVCTVTDFSAAKKARGVKLCTRVGLLCEQVFSPSGEHWLAGSHGGGGIISGMNRSGGRAASGHGMGIWNWGRRRCLRPYGGVCVLQACWRTCFCIFCILCVLAFLDYCSLCCHYQCNWLPGKTVPQMTGILCVKRDVKQLFSVHSLTSKTEQGEICSITCLDVRAIIGLWRN